MTRYQVSREETYINLTILANRSIDLFRLIGNHQVFNSTTIRTKDKMGKCIIYTIPMQESKRQFPR